MKFPTNIEALLGSAWHIADAGLIALESAFARYVAAIEAGPFDPPELEPEESNGLLMDGETAVIPLHGVIGIGLADWEKRYFGMADLDDFNAALTTAREDPAVKAIRLDIDSPGGSVRGVYETMQRVSSTARGVKPVEAVSDSMMASAAYFIGSQAGRIRVSTSSMVGSIGTMLRVVDSSAMYREAGLKVSVLTNKEAEFKGAGTPGTSLTAAQKTQIVNSIQWLHDQSAAAISTARPALKPEYMRAQVVSGGQAYWEGTGLVDDLLPTG